MQWSAYNSDITHPGDGQGLVEVLSSRQAETPGGRPIQHDIEWHDPLISPAVRTAAGSKLHTVGITVKEQSNIKVMEVLNHAGGGAEGGE